MDIHVEQLSDAEVSALTCLLRRSPKYGISRPSTKWLTRQQRLIEHLPPDLRAYSALKRMAVTALRNINPLLLPPSAILCPAHAKLNPILVRRLFQLVADEVTHQSDRLRSAPGKSPLVAEFLLRINAINMYWMTPEYYAQVVGDLPTNIRYQRIRSWCEACVLSAIGGDALSLSALRANLKHRSNIPRKVRLPKSGKRRKKKKKVTPRLWRFVEKWIDHVQPEDPSKADDIRRESDLAAQEIATTWRRVLRTKKAQQGNNQRNSGISDPEWREDEEYNIPGPQKTASTEHDDLATLAAQYEIPNSLRELYGQAARICSTLTASDNESNATSFSVMLSRLQSQTSVNRPQGTKPAIPVSNVGNHETGHDQDPRPSRAVDAETRDSRHFAQHDSGYRQRHEVKYEERDLEAEARSRQKVVKWYAQRNKTGPEYRDSSPEEVSIHPMFQQRAYDVPSAVPSPLNLARKRKHAEHRADGSAAGNEAREREPKGRPRRSADTKELAEYSVYDDENYTDITALTNGDLIYDNENERHAPSLPPIPAKYLPHDDQPLGDEVSL